MLEYPPPLGFFKVKLPLELFCRETFAGAARTKTIYENNIYNFISIEHNFLIQLKFFYFKGSVLENNSLYPFNFSRTLPLKRNLNF